MPSATYVVPAAAPALGTLNPTVTAGDGKVVLSAMSEAGFAFYYKSTPLSDAANKPAVDSTNLSGWTAFTANTDVAVQKGTQIFVQVIKVDTGNKIKAWGETSAIANVDDQGSVFVGNRLLVSNQSTDYTAAQSTGTLNMDEMKQMMGSGSPELEMEAYRIDSILPFTPIKDKPLINLSYKSGPELAAGDTTKVFNTKNFSTNKYETLTARLAYSGTNVQVWVETGSPKVTISDAKAQQIGTEFDTKIYPMVRDNFNTESDVNGDSKVAILCFDIQDGFSGSGGYIAGYFWGGDLYSTTDVPNSNEMELFYIDTYPLTITDLKNPDYTNPDVTQAYSTLAHEFQHMVNFYRQATETSGKVMDTWLNEALSLAAEHMYEGVQTSRINYYNNSDTVRNGRSLLDWQNNNDVLANYSLSYLFSQYLRTQLGMPSDGVGGVKYFHNIIIDNENGYKAVENVVHSQINNKLSFGEFMTNFRAAMLLKANSGYFGFGGDSAFNGLSTPKYTGGTTNLVGGGAVVKEMGAAFTDPGNKGTDVNYLGIFKP